MNRGRKREGEEEVVKAEEEEGQRPETDRKEKRDELVGMKRCPQFDRSEVTVVPHWC